MKRLICVPNADLDIERIAQQEKARSFAVLQRTPYHSRPAHSCRLPDDPATYLHPGHTIVGQLVTYRGEGWVRTLVKVPGSNKEVYCFLPISMGGTPCLQEHTRDLTVDETTPPGYRVLPTASTHFDEAPPDYRLTATPSTHLNPGAETTSGEQMGPPAASTGCGTTSVGQLQAPRTSTQASQPGSTGAPQGIVVQFKVPAEWRPGQLLTVQHPRHGRPVQLRAAPGTNPGSTVRATLPAA